MDHGELAIPAAHCAIPDSEADLYIARITLLTLLILLGYGLAAEVTHTDEAPREGETATETTGDIDLYQTIIDRMSAGEGFYAVTGDEQLRRGYPLRPFLTWRLPTTAWLISNLGESGAAGLLALLALLAMLAWVGYLRVAGLSRVQVIGGAVLAFSGLMLMVMPRMIYLHEAWSGTLLALSLLVWGKSWRLSVLCGLAALAFRELALPFVLLMMGIALWEGRLKEAAWWGLGVLLFLGGLALHASMVATYAGPEAPAGAGWLAMGGWPFLLATSRWNLFVILTGNWLAALCLPLVLLGSQAWQGSVGLRLKLILWGYCLAFLFVGRSNNDYWGVILAPILGVSLIFAPRVIATLWRRSFPSPPGNEVRMTSSEWNSRR